MPELTSILDALWAVWRDGGGLMWPITLMALLIYTESLRLCLKVAFHPISTVQPGSGQLSPRQQIWLERVSKEEYQGEFDEHLLAQTKQQLHGHYQRRIRWLGSFIKCCPLLGLLGTVTGMGATFDSLQDSGLSQAEGMAAGISEALITTQYGLMVAIPGLFMTSFIKERVTKIDRNLLRLHLSSFHHIASKSESEGTSRDSTLRRSLRGQSISNPPSASQGI